MPLSPIAMTQKSEFDGKNYEQQHIYGSLAYQTLYTLKTQENLTQIISLIDLESKENMQEAINETKKLANQLELRDALTLVIGKNSQFESVLPAKLSEAMISYDRQTGDIDFIFSKTRDPPLVRAIISLLGMFGLFIVANLVNIQYVDKLSGKVTQGQIKLAENEKGSRQQLYSTQLR